jgi:hypothetical protein
MTEIAMESEIDDHDHVHSLPLSVNELIAIIDRNQHTQEGFNVKVSKDVLSAMLIEDIRETVKSIRKNIRTMNKSDSRYSSYMNLLVDLVAHERTRPIEEHFPHLLIDMDDMRKNLQYLESSSLRLVGNQGNVAKEMEDSLGVMFRKWLESHGYEDVDSVALVNGEILAGKGKSLVQWDNVLGASYRGKECIFFMECKDIGHPNDIIYLPTEMKDKKLDLITKTYQYMKETIPIVDVNSTWRGIRSQIGVLKVYENAELVFVYGCGSRISDSLRSRVETFQSEFAANVGNAANVWLMSSLRCGEVTVIIPCSEDAS